MKQKLLLKSLVLLFALIAGSMNVWAQDPEVYSLQLSSSKKFSASGLTDGSIIWSATNNEASIGNWSSDYNGQQFGTSSTKGNVVLSTSSITGTITRIDIYSQTGTSGGATVAVSVGGTSWGSENMKVPSATGETPGLLTFTGSKTGTIQITLTQSKKKAMYLNKIVITYTPSSTPSSGASFATESPSIDWPTSLTYTQVATTASGYSTTDGASVTYSIGSTNTCAATIDSGTGEVTPTKGGSVQVVATAAAIDGHFTQSTASYTLTVNDVREAATLSWSEDAVEIMKDAVSYTLPTLNNPNSLDVTYEATGTVASVTDAGVVTVNTGTVGSSTIKAIFTGNTTYKAKTVSYTINVIDPTVKGSKYNPYTVTEVRAVSTTTKISDVYVEGYIVGYVNSTYDFTSDESLFQNSNWAIADSKTETDKANTTPVQIASANQANFGLLNHPELVGAKVLIKGDITKYFNVSGVKNLDEISIVSVPATINSTYEWATYSSTIPLDFTGTGVSAYIVTGFEGSAVTKTQVNKVPANTGLLLNGTTDNIPLATGDLDDVSANKMVAVTTATTISKVDGKTRYVLADEGGKAMFLSINATPADVPAGKAYLEITGDGARELYFDDTTAINALENATKIDNGAIYDLSGRRVENPTKGIYIINGKKVIFK